MNKILFLFLFCLCSHGFAQEDCDPNESFSIASALSIPNCNTPKNIRDAKRGRNTLCGECKTKFESFNKDKITAPSKEKIQAQFLKVTFDEYKKNLIQNLVSAVKSRTLGNSGTNYEKSISSCSFKRKDDFLAQCSSPAAKEALGSLLDDKSGLLKDLKTQLSNEIASIVSDSPSLSPNTLLERSERACFIKEEDVILLKNLSTEESLRPSFITAIQGLDISQFNTTDEMLQSSALAGAFQGDLVTLLESLRGHPLLNDAFQSPAKFSSLFKSIASPYDSNELRKVLYSKENGQKTDEALAQSCQDSFQALTKSLCSQEFAQGNIYIDPFNNLDKLYSDGLKPSNDEFSTTEEMFENNTKLLSLCEMKKTPQSQDLSQVNLSISKNLNNTNKDLPLTYFRHDKYEQDIGNYTNALCSLKSPCDESDVHCRMLNSLKDKNSTIGKLASSSNTEVNSLLRSMIGDTKDLEPKTKAILIAQGIIPKDDGTIVAQPDIPERRPEYFAKTQNSINSPVGRGTVAQASASQSSAGRIPSSVRDEGYSNAATNQNASYSLPDISDIVRGSSDELKDIQNEIRRRLSDLPSGRPATVQEAKRIAQNSFQAKGRNLTPAQETVLAERMMQPSSPTPTSSIFDSPSRDESRNLANVSDTDSQLEKWKKGRMNAALADMAGAQNVDKAAILAGGASASGASPKDMSKVALNIAEDPRVTLSEIFKDKFDRNDPETQLLKVLLRSENNFLLQVKSMSFKVIFDEKKNFNILLESGDRAQAERMRPQLEMFLKRLKS